MVHSHSQTAQVDIAVKRHDMLAANGRSATVIQKAKLDHMGVWTVIGLELRFEES